MSKTAFGLSLIELVLAIVLMSLIILSLANIDVFSHFHVISASRWTAAQSEATLALDHIAKEINNAVGNTAIANQFPVDISNIAGDYGVKVWVDGDNDGSKDSYPDDHQIAYRFTAGNGAPADQWQIWYYDTCVGPNCNQAGSTAPERISYQITGFTAGVTGNAVNVSVTARWRANQALSRDNPEVTMSSSIKMPAVSTN